MEKDNNGNNEGPNIRQPSYNNMPDETPRREGGDDALAETDPGDARADEKVIVNEQWENKTLNTPSQTAVNSSESAANEEDTI